MKKEYFKNTKEIIKEMNSSFDSKDSGAGALVVLLPIIVVVDILESPFILYHNLKLKNE